MVVKETNWKWVILSALVLIFSSVGITYISDNYEAFTQEKRINSSHNERELDRLINNNTNDNNNNNNNAETHNYQTYTFNLD